MCDVDLRRTVSLTRVNTELRAIRTITCLEVRSVTFPRAGQSMRKSLMFDLSVREVMERNKALRLSPDTTVSEAAQKMAKIQTGAVMVVEHGRLIGIFTERDALFRVMARGLDPLTTRLADVMTSETKTVKPDDSYGYALVLMQEGGFRHAPVIEDGKPIGIVSSRNAMDPDLEQFTSEANRREYIRRTRH